ncbi:ABC transporter permease [Stygiolobus azoricus]|uniref:ABC transporter permease subunit n=1 Tax=Stygiolobus azoricus TaxID=41675 RepID=A0A650CPB6_9CREN|nr:ABC transporter permease [Stygiolobus azoricus]QGR19613.1 ABC transporter permease subunit [Stygiolobus azoricus]
MNKLWLIRRFLMAFLTIIITIIISWALIEYSPNSPANAILSNLRVTEASNPKFAQIYASELQFYKDLVPHGNPIIESLNYIIQVLHGNLGLDVISEEPVSAIIAQALPWTIFIVSTSLIISFFIGIRIGQKMGYKRGTKLDSSLTTFFTLLRSIPLYISGAILLFILGFELHIFPAGGAYSPTITPGLSLAFIESVLYHAVLPIFTLTLANLAGWALQMRANTIYTLGEDYVSFAEIRGVKDKLIETKYVGRNAILPLYTSLIISIGFSIGGSVFVEEIFSYPGIGNQLYYAITNNDYTLEMGIFIIIITAVVVGVLLADLTYSLIDPRVRNE